jgi:hypothetical protein
MQTISPPKKRLEQTLMLDCRRRLMTKYPPEQTLMLNCRRRLMETPLTSLPKKPPE